MDRDIWYLGDTSSDSAAAYLLGLISAAEWSCRYVPSDQQVALADWDKPASLYIFSDYPAANLSADAAERVMEHVERGAGLMMIGGWESFHGLGGDWDEHRLARILPVEIGRDDDRLNCDQPLIVRQVTNHAVVEDLPWNDRPPLIGGLNRVSPRSDATVLLEANRFSGKWRGERYELERGESWPLLVVGQHGKGRVATLMTDVAPHWVGPLVDWGTERVTASAEQASEVEVGNLYAQFFWQLLGWTGNLDAAHV